MLISKTLLQKFIASISEFNHKGYEPPLMRLTSQKWSQSISAVVYVSAENTSELALRFGHFKAYLKSVEAYLAYPYP